MSDRRSLVIDCDPGCDDALALILAFASGEYGHVRIHTVAGNVGVRQTTTNALRLCALAKAHGLLDHGATVSVFRGAGTSLRGELPSAASVHGRDGLGNAPLAALVRDSSAFLELVESFWRGPLNDAPEVTGRPELVCTGPLTNLASQLLALPPDGRSGFWRRWKRVVIMGGAINNPGNISYAAEFNVHADPDALAIVLESWNEHLREEEHYPTPLVLVPLDVTEKLVLWDPRGNLGGTTPLGAALLCLLRKYFLFHALSYDPPLGRRTCAGAYTTSGVAFPPNPRHWQDDPWVRREVAKTVKNTFQESRGKGGSGLKKLPRWCFLHDPVAMWVSLRWNELGLGGTWRRLVETLRSAQEEVGLGPLDGLRVCTARLVRGDHEMRGHVLQVEPRRSFYSTGDDARGDLLIVPVLDQSVVQGLRSRDRRGFLATLTRVIWGTTPVRGH